MSIDTDSAPEPRGARPRRWLIAGGVAVAVLSLMVLVRTGVLGPGESWKGAQLAASNRDKRSRFEAGLNRDWVTLRLDARHPGVKLPAEFLGRRDFVLQYGRDMPRPIPDLAFDDQGVSATLSFQGQPYLTFVPWTAVFLIGDREGRGTWYREDMPPEVRAGMEQQKR